MEELENIPPNDQKYPPADDQPLEHLPASPSPLANEIAAPKHGSNKKLLYIIIVIVLLIIVAASFWLLGRHSSTDTTPAKPVASATKATPKTAATTKLPGLQLDTSKNYGNKYSSGIVPVGDGKYVTSAPKQGYVYACTQYVQSFSNDRGGAGSRGPWFTSNNTEYDLNKKAHVGGSVMWQASFTNNISGATRTIITNDLPTHATGIFPIMSSDAAYAYDRNPNRISAQNLTYSLSASPTYGSPNCMGGEVGIMLTGVALFSAFDAGGRDAGAWEVQDACDGHPQNEGLYHYHSLSACIKDTSVHTVIGYALDGFPITGPQVSTNNILTTSDLDECHGLTSQILLDGRAVTMYHYVMTQDFPYSVSCYRAMAAQPPGMPQH